jgi:hypothetical protein
MLRQPSGKLSGFGVEIADPRPLLAPPQQPADQRQEQKVRNDPNRNL